jgi:hypothetical protein
MNKKLAIFGFSVIWIAAIAAILFVMVPKLSSSTGAEYTTVKNTEDNFGDNTITTSSKAKDEDSFFYDKKVFVRHRKSDTDTTGVNEKIIIVRKNIFFKPPVKPKPDIKPLPKKEDNADFDIKPVPKN